MVQQLIAMLILRWRCPLLDWLLYVQEPATFISSISTKRSVVQVQKALLDFNSFFSSLKQHYRTIPAMQHSPKVTTTAVFAKASFLQLLDELHASGEMTEQVGPEMMILALA